MIQFIKKYAVTHSDGIFKILIAKHEDDIVYGSIVYHTINSSSSATRIAESNIEIVPGVDEEGVLTNCINWIQKNIPGEIEVKILFE